MLVQVAVHRAGINIHIGVLLLDALDALGHRHQHQKLDMLAAPALHLGDGGISGTAGGQHGVHDEDIPLGYVLGHLAEIGVGLQRLLVPVHTDVAHAGGRYHPQHTVHQAQAGPQDGADGDLFACQGGLLRFAQRGFHQFGGQGQVTGGLIGNEHTDLGDQLAEVFHAGIFIAEDG